MPLDHSSRPRTLMRTGQLPFPELRTVPFYFVFVKYTPAVPLTLKHICPFSVITLTLNQLTSAPPYLLRLHPHVSLLQDTFPSN